jgi:hypothetical protein
VAGGSGPANQAAAAAVQTGLELSIDLGDLGYVSGDILVCAFVNNQFHNYASNQFLGPLQPPRSNLGSDGNGGFTGVVNFNLAGIAGAQYFTCMERAIPVQGTTWSRIKTLKSN